MVNKRFNRKFRRALGAALGALSVASISNVDVVNAVLTESAIDADPQLRYFFMMDNFKKERLWTAIQGCINQIRYDDKRTWIYKTFIAHIGNVSISHPQILPRNNKWSGVNFTIKCPGNPCVRLCLLKITDGLIGTGYLLTPPMTVTEFLDYSSCHQLPEIGTWLAPNVKREDVVFHIPLPPGCSWLRHDTPQDQLPPGPGNIMRGDTQNHPIAAHDIVRGEYATKKNFKYIRRMYLERRWNPAVGQQPLIPAPPPPPPPPPLAPGGPPVAPPVLLAPHNTDAPYLTNWFDNGLMDSSILDTLLESNARHPKMFDWTLDKCPPELQDFYYPKKEEPIIFTPSDSTPVSLPDNTSINNANMAAVGLCAATTIAASTLTSSPSPTNTNVGSAQSTVNASSGNTTTSTSQVQSTENNTSPSAVEGNNETSKS